MKVISHRGYWKSASEKNTQVAFERSFSLGFGTETDVRDLGGQLVISHDVPAGGEVTFAQMLTLAGAHHTASVPLTLALNIKADGLAQALGRALEAWPGLDCFVFDMAVPDMRAYLAAGIPAYTRMSEVEPVPAWLDRSAGVWLDAFESPWYSHEQVSRLLDEKAVCVVSNELHRRDHRPHWEWLARHADHPNLTLCTDLPEEAVRFFSL